MSNLIDYVKWRGDLSFESAPFNEVDNAVLCFLSYVNFELGDQLEGTFRDVSNALIEKLKDDESKVVGGLIVPHTIIDLLKIAKDSHRFGDIEFSDFENYISIEEKCQFCAMTFHLTKKEMAVVYRGTDDSTIGWQENLEMIVGAPVCGETKAKEYLDKIAKKYRRKRIWVLGHSKGGHLSEYASIYCLTELHKRIIRVYSNDGPGFLDGVYDEAKFERIKDKIVLLLPKESVVGVLFSKLAGNIYVLESNKRGVFQHDMLNWHVNTTEFERSDELSDKSKKIEVEVSKLIASLNDKERQEIAEDVYNFISASKVYTLTMGINDLGTVIKNLGTIKFKNKKLFLKFFGIIL